MGGIVGEMKLEYLMHRGQLNETFIHMFAVSGDGCGDVAA